VRASSFTHQSLPLSRALPFLTRAPTQEETLTGKAGLAHVYATFQDELRAGFKGRGHEAADLKRLIDLYRGWHRRLYPYVVRACMRACVRACVTPARTHTPELTLHSHA
jgi:hypothetical protein